MVFMISTIDKIFYWRKFLHITTLNTKCEVIMVGVNVGAMKHLPRIVELRSTLREAAKSGQVGSSDLTT